VTTVLASPLVESTRPTPLRAPAFTGPAALLGLFGFLVSVAGSWIPSYWGDEAASVMSAERSLPSLFGMLGNIDAVHGTYYLLLHGWIDAFGATELSTRLPSALAIGLATAGTAVLARMLMDTRVAVLAGLVFAVLPRVTYMGAEARSTALATMLAVWTVVLLVHTVRSGNSSPLVRAGLWSGYALLVACGAYVFLYTILLIPVHALVAAVLSRRRRSGTVAVWAGAAVGGLVLAAPVFYWGIGEREQISFLARRPAVGVIDAAVQQWFGTPALAAVAWALILLGALVTFVPRLRTAGQARRAGLLVVLTWAVLPSAALLLGTWLIAPMYSLRYLSICAPAAAVAVAVGAATLRPKWTQAVAVLLIGALALPGYLAQRTDFAKDNGSDWRQVSDILRAEARQGDAVVFDESTKPSQRPRLAMHLYPGGFIGLSDVSLNRSYQDVDWLWDTTIPLAESTSRLTDTNRVWLLQNVGSPESSAGTDLGLLQQLGFTVHSSLTVHRTIVTELTR